MKEPHGSTQTAAAQGKGLGGSSGKAVRKAQGDVTTETQLLFPRLSEAEFQQMFKNPTTSPKNEAATVWIRANQATSYHQSTSYC